MQETQIKVEILEHTEIFPIFLKYIAKKHNIQNISLKKYKNYLLISTSSSSEHLYNLAESFFWFNNFFKVQKIIFDYKCSAK